MNKELFLSNEGDNYYERNKYYLYKDDDIILNKLSNYKFHELQNYNILEIGCSNGWRLNEMFKLNPNNNYYGIDPSTNAVNNGFDNFKNISLSVGTCDSIKYNDNYFDIILIPFVFMYIDRELLLKSIAEIDRLLKNNGILIITDFYSNRQRKNEYKHSLNKFIYKQNYFEIFLNSKNYFLNYLICFNHNTSQDSDNYDDTCYYVELKKDLLHLFN